MRLKFRITKKDGELQHTKIGEMGVYMLQGREFGLPKNPRTITHENWQNEGFTYSGHTKIGKIRGLLSPGSKFWITKNPWTIAHQSRQNVRFTCSDICLTLKMGRFGREGQLAP
ncbi:hypothetical protein H5410_058790 [Solanum commersonii]|uniref:Uncharacterized protein n=1 Tax=Solanum commersonii TaxID=4109 RepID=A0A9J5WUJ4_SOLCO|nr:hypothetical protein H5410_058790 [Solanum commersonii]